MTLTMTKILLVAVQFHYMVEIGKIQLDLIPAVSEEVIEDCSRYLVTISTTNILDCIYNTGILFCRFVYARHALELTTDKVKIVHFLVCCVTGTFTVQGLFLGPIGMLAKQDLVKKTRLCTSGSLDFVSLKSQDNGRFYQVGLIIITFTTLLVLCNLHFTNAALKLRRRYKIPTRSINYVSLKEQSFYIISLLISFIVERSVKAMLVYNYNVLDLKTISLCWWAFQLSFILIFNILAPIYILFSILQKDEYRGLVAKKLTEQEKPRIWMFEPRREQRETIVRACNQPQLHVYLSSNSNEAPQHSLYLEVKPYRCFTLQNEEETRPRGKSHERQQFMRSKRKEGVADLPDVSI